jgi:hypothetical protein
MGKICMLTDGQERIKYVMDIIGKSGCVTE